MTFYGSLASRSIMGSRAGNALIAKKSELKMKEKPWACTLMAQLSLCVVAYIALSIGQPRKLSHDEASPKDMYFISIAGGFRPLEQQTLLVQQMVKVAKTFKVRFVVGFSELGESDPLLQNATMFPELRKLPWYPAVALEGEGATYFLKKIRTPYGQSLDVIVLDTSTLQDWPSARANDQIDWLTRNLNESDSDWKVVIGFHQLISCGNNIRTTKESLSEHLRNILLQYGVDAYMSMKTCAVPMDKTPYLTVINPNLNSEEESVDGFLLHQISSLEMVTFAVKLTGEVEPRLTFQQKGRAAM